MQSTVLFVKNMKEIIPEVQSTELFVNNLKPEVRPAMYDSSGSPLLFTDFRVASYVFMSQMSNSFEITLPMNQSKHIKDLMVYSL